MPARVDPLFVPGFPDLAPQLPTFTGGDFPLTPTLDDFNRANGPLGANWTTPWLGSAGSGNINGTQMFLDTGTGASPAAAWNQAYGPDCEVYERVQTLPAAGSQIFLDLRRQSLISVLTDGYELRITPSTGDWRIRKLVGGANTVLAIFGPVPVALGDWIGFRALGNTLTAYWQSRSGGGFLNVGSVVDSTFPDVIGYIGTQSNGASNTSVNVFGGGSLSPTVVSTPLTPNALTDPLFPPSALTLYPSQQPYYPPVVSGDVSISGTIGTLALTSDLSAVLESLAPSVGTLTLSASTSAIAEALQPNVGSLSLGAGTSAIQVALSPSVAVLLLGAGISSLSLTNDITISGTIGNLSLTGGTNVQSLALPSVTGSLILSAAAPVVQEALLASPGTLNLTAAVSQVAMSLNEAIGVLTLSAGTSVVSGRGVNAPIGILVLSADASSTTGGTAAAGSKDALLWLYYVN